MHQLQCTECLVLSNGCQHAVAIPDIEKWSNLAVLAAGFRAFAAPPSGCHRFGLECICGSSSSYSLSTHTYIYIYVIIYICISVWTGLGVSGLAWRHRLRPSVSQKSRTAIIYTCMITAVKVVTVNCQFLTCACHFNFWMDPVTFEDGCAEPAGRN